MRWLRERVMPARRGRLAGGGVTAALAVGMAFAGGIGAALSPGSARLAAAEDEVPVSATPSCPGGGAGMPVDAPCTALKVHGNTYVDNNRNGRYDPNTGDTRLSGVVVKLLDPATGGVIGQAVTNADGYYSFPLLPVGPNYGVQVECPGGCQPTTPVYREFELRDFSTYWCCSARADFGCYQSGFVPGNPPPPPPGPPGLPPGKPPCCDIPSGQQTHIPILNYQANDNTCSTIIEVQNVGAWDSKALLVVWGAHPKAGAPNPEVDLYVYDVAAKKSTKIAVRPGAFDEGIGHYVYGIRWSPDNRELWFHRTNRKQDVMEWCGADPETGKVRVIVREEWPKSWTENQPRRVFLDTDPNIEKAPAYRGKAIWFSERNRFKNLYLLDLATGALRPITQNDFEVASIVRVDLPGGRLWYMGRDGDNPYKLQLHRVGLDGKGDIRLTDPRFNHTVSLAPDGRHFVDIAEAIDSPPVTRLLDGSGKVVDTLAESDLTKFKELGLRPVERIVFTAADGKTTCYGTLHVPSRLKDGEKIPLIVQVYAGPESGSDQERFQTPNPLTEMGYCVASFDGRGTSGRGKAFKDELYGKLGIVEIDDQAAGVRHLVRTKPFIDGKRVGIEGTSYGGYASIMALLRYPDVFAAACASSSVTDWRNYDTIYTERYMNTPQANPEGYDAGSATKIAASLKGRLMLYYGTADDNVHPSNTYQFVRALQSARKGYDLQVGPDAGHSGIGQERMLEFFNDWLKR